jgi:hypothetical protein
MFDSRDAGSSSGTLRFFGDAMNCRDAEFFLRFRRPGVAGAGEVAPEVAAALEQHLASCSGCAGDARAAAAFDSALGAAMRAVDVPAGLRERLISQGLAHRGAVLRRRAYSLAALAASLFLAVGLAAGIFSASRPYPDTAELAMKASNLEHVLRFDAGPIAVADARLAEENRAALAQWLKSEGLPADLPVDFDYSLLISQHWEDVQGRKVPVVLFRGRDQGFAKVYIFRETQFKLKGLQDANYSNCQALVYPVDRTPAVTFVIVFTGRDLTPFVKTQGRGASGVT